MELKGIGINKMELTPYLVPPHTAVLRRYEPRPHLPWLGIQQFRCIGVSLLSTVVRVTPSLVTRCDYCVFCVLWCDDIVEHVEKTFRYLYR